MKVKSVLRIQFSRWMMCLLGVTMVVVSSKAQYVPHKAVDHCYAGFQIGAVSPLCQHSVVRDARMELGWHFGKQLTPIFGLELQSLLGVNTSKVHAEGTSTVFDDIQSSILAVVNVSNMFYGYVGPRCFNIHAIYGFGHKHFYRNEGQGDDFERFTSTAGLRFNFRVGKEKAWGFSLFPNVVWDLSRQTYSASYAQLNVTAGVTYYFPSSNGKHYITRSRLYDQSEVDALNAKIKDLRQMVKERDVELQQLKAQ